MGSFKDARAICLAIGNLEIAQVILIIAVTDVRSEGFLRTWRVGYKYNGEEKEYVGLDCILWLLRWQP